MALDSSVMDMLQFLCSTTENSSEIVEMVANTMSTANLSKRWTQSLNYKLEPVIDICRDYFFKNHEKFGDLTQFTFAHVKNLCINHGFDSEEQLYMFIKKWTATVTPDIKLFKSEILSQVKLNLLPPLVLTNEVVPTGWYTSDELLAAYIYQSNNKANQQVPQKDIIFYIGHNDVTPNGYRKIVEEDIPKDSFDTAFRKFVKDNNNSFTFLGEHRLPGKSVHWGIALNNHFLYESKLESMIMIRNEIIDGKISLGKNFTLSDQNFPLEVGYVFTDNHLRYSLYVESHVKFD